MIARRNTRFVSLVFAESDVPLHTCQQLHHPVQHHRRARVHAPSLPLICQCIECQAKSLLVCVSACGTRQWTAFERARAGALRIAAAPHVAGEQLDATSSVSSCTCKRARAHTHTHARTHAHTHCLSVLLCHTARAHTHTHCLSVLLCHTARARTHTASLQIDITIQTRKLPAVLRASTRIIVFLCLRRVLKS